MTRSVCRTCSRSKSKINSKLVDCLKYIKMKYIKIRGFCSYWVMVQFSISGLSLLEFYFARLCRFHRLGVKLRIG